MSLNFLNAAISVVLPINNTNVTGAFGPLVVFNVSYINGTDFSDATNATFYYNLSGIWTKIGSSVPVLGCSKAAAGSLESCNVSLNMSGLTSGRYSINVTLANLSTSGANAATNYTLYGASNLIFNFTVDSIPPAVIFAETTVNKGNYSGIIILNASVSDNIMGVNSVYFNITFTNGTQIYFNKSTNVSGGYYNFSLNTSALADGYYNITVYANDTQLNNVNKTERIMILVDNTIPTGAFLCSPASVTSADTVECSCTPSDTLSGPDFSSLSYSNRPSVETVGTFTLNCSFLDYARNAGSVTTQYTVRSTPSGFSSSSSSGGSPLTNINSFNKVIPGQLATIKNLNAEGISQITFQVNSEATNVQIAIDSSSAKPSSVSDKKDSYKYLHINTENLLDKLSKATLTIKVQKTWIAGKNLGKSDISLYKYDESAKKWNELTTTFSSEDSNYNYYTVELNSFSYFVIAPKQTSAVINEEEQTAAGEQEPVTTSSGNYWWWIAGIIIIGIIVGLTFPKFFKKKKKR